MESELLGLNKTALQNRIQSGLGGMSGESAAEKLYLLAVALAAFVGMFDTSMLVYKFAGAATDLMVLFAICAAAVKLAADREWNLLRMMLLFGIAFTFGRNGSRIGDRDCYVTAALIIGAHGVDFRKIAKVYLAVSMVSLAVIMAGALTGHIQNLVYMRGGRQRISFGIVYPTDFCAHVFFLTACWVWLRERRVTMAEIIGIGGLAGFCLYFCDARNSFLCLLLLAVGLLYVRCRRRLAEKRGGEYSMSQLVSGLLCLSMPLGTITMIGLSAVYNPANPLLEKLNQLLSGRLHWGHIGLETYNPFSLFGQAVRLQGLGMSTGPVTDFFFLDSSYLNILLCNGVIILAIVLLTFVLAGLRQRKLGGWERLGILAVIAVHCMIEHHLLEYMYHPFLFMLFTTEALLPAGKPALKDPSKATPG